MFVQKLRFDTPKLYPLLEFYNIFLGFFVASFIAKTSLKKGFKVSQKAQYLI